MTGLSNGEINVFYSPLTSINGAKLLLSKGPPRKRNIEDVSDAQAAPNIITPHELPMFRDQDATGSKRKREKERMDPKKSRRPELPVTGPGRGGRVGASATQHVVQNLVRDTTRDEDVRFFFLSLKVYRRGEWVIREGYLDTAFTPVDVPLERPILKRLSASELCFFIDVPIVPCDSLLTTFARHILQPREALLKYAKLAEEDPQWTGGTQFFASRAGAVNFRAPNAAPKLLMGVWRPWCVSVLTCLPLFFFAHSLETKPTESCLPGGGTGVRKGRVDRVSYRFVVVVVVIDADK